jgi:hypothetical protein
MLDLDRSTDKKLRKDVRRGPPWYQGVMVAIIVASDYPRRTKKP